MILHDFTTEKYRTIVLNVDKFCHFLVVSSKKEGLFGEIRGER
jgi:hypothetical protein